MVTLSPHERLVATTALREQADARYAKYPQYVGYFDGWVLVEVKTLVRYKGGNLPAGLTIGTVRPDGTVSVLNPTNNHVCITPAGSVTFAN
jgi:hypothetical protein